MPITLLDVILLVVMLISALLAMVRGFMREVLSIASWAAAALLTLYSYPKLKPIVLQYFSNDIVASDRLRPYILREFATHLVSKNDPYGVDVTNVLKNAVRHRLPRTDIHRIVNACYDTILRHSGC